VKPGPREAKTAGRKDGGLGTGGGWLGGTSIMPERQQCAINQLSPSESTHSPKDHSYIAKNGVLQVIKMTTGKRGLKERAMRLVQNR